MKSGPSEISGSLLITTAEIESSSVEVADEPNSLFKSMSLSLKFCIIPINNFEPLIRCLSKIKCQPHLLNLLTDMKRNNSVAMVE
jgi:hypothetical protein